MLEGSCHCGAVRLRVPAAPDTVTDCNCSICRRLGALWAYYASGDVSIGPIADTTAYVWGDRTLSIHHCNTCGCTTHWQGLGDYADRVGVNARLFNPAFWQGAATRKLDRAAK